MLPAILLESLTSSFITLVRDIQWKYMYMYMCIRKRVHVHVHAELEFRMFIMRGI